MEDKLKKLRDNLTVEEKEILAKQFNIRYNSLGNILRGTGAKKKQKQIFIAGMEIINMRENKYREAVDFVESL
jgi:hypothetical protein